MSREAMQQAQPVAWRYRATNKSMEWVSAWAFCDSSVKPIKFGEGTWEVQPLYTTPPAPVVPQPLTIERLRAALVAARIIPPEAVEDADNYDDGVMLARIEALHRRIA